MFVEKKVAFSLCGPSSAGSSEPPERLAKGFMKEKKEHLSAYWHVRLIVTFFYIPSVPVGLLMLAPRGLSGHRG